jgi:uncharacterized phage protein (TIGR01671 family)
MREIKFRGITGTTEGKKWAYGYLYKIKSFFSEDYQYFIKNEHLQETSVDEETIGQYTGLKDKNGKEIYEGDIIYVIPEDETAFILWDKETAKYIIQFKGWCADFDNYYGKELEVIGNIYDNPELLEK